MARRKRRKCKCPKKRRSKRGGHVVLRGRTRKGGKFGWHTLGLDKKGLSRKGKWLSNPKNIEQMIKVGKIAAKAVG